MGIANRALTRAWPRRMVLWIKLPLRTSKWGMPAGRRFKMHETNTPPGTVLLLEIRQRVSCPFRVSKFAQYMEASTWIPY